MGCSDGYDCRKPFRVRFLRRSMPFWNRSKRNRSKIYWLMGALPNLGIHLESEQLALLEGQKKDFIWSQRGFQSETKTNISDCKFIAFCPKGGALRGKGTMYFVGCLH